MFDASRSREITSRTKRATPNWTYVKWHGSVRVEQQHIHTSPTLSQPPVAIKGASKQHATCHPVTCSARELRILLLQKPHGVHPEWGPLFKRLSLWSYPNMYYTVFWVKYRFFSAKDSTFANILSAIFILSHPINCYKPQSLYLSIIYKKPDM